MALFKKRKALARKRKALARKRKALGVYYRPYNMLSTYGSEKCEFCTGKIWLGPHYHGYYLSFGVPKSGIYMTIIDACFLMDRKIWEDFYIPDYRK